MKLSVACLMASLKALPPSLLCHGDKEVKVMERWHLLACSRLCVVGKKGAIAMGLCVVGKKGEPLQWGYVL